MIIVTYLLLTLEVIVAILLLMVILMQKSKGGLGSIGGGASEAILGAGAGNVLTKATVVLGITFLVNTLLLAIIFSNQAKSSIISEGLPTTPPPALPGGTPAPAPATAPGTGIPVTPIPIPAPTPPGNAGVSAEVEGGIVDPDAVPAPGN